MHIRRLSGHEVSDLAGLVLQRGHPFRFQAGGISMLPFIQDGDILEIVPAAEKRLRRGNIILVQAGGGKLLAHRIIKIRSLAGEAAFLIKGDACARPDGWFTKENILGRVNSIEHAGQRIILNSKIQRWKANLWIWLAPLSTKASWLPYRLRRCIRKMILGNMV